MIQLEQRVRQLVESHDVDLIIVDNLHLIDKGMAINAHAYQTLESHEIGHCFKTLAREHGLLILLRVPLPHIQKWRHRKTRHSSDGRHCAARNGSEHLLCLYRDVPSSLEAAGDKVMTILISIAKQQKSLVTEVEAALVQN